MIFLKIRRRFHERSSEWFCAANMFLWGMTLLHPSISFVSPAFTSFGRVISENAIGWIVGGLGFLWLLGLIVNGAMQATTSTIRAVCACIGALVYGFLALGFVVSYFLNGILSTGIGNYSLISVLALYSLYWIMKDKRATQ